MREPTRRPRDGGRGANSEIVRRKKESDGRDAVIKRDEHDMRWYFNTAKGNFRGFFLHDDRTQVASLRVYFSIRDYVDVPCDMPLPAMRAQGLHETGNCGFVFDNDLMEMIRERPNFAVFETGSGVILYRRLGGSGFIPSKLCVLAPRFVALHPMIEALRRRCQLSYTNVHLQSRETLITTFNNNYSDSIFVSGAIDWVKSENFAKRANFTSVLFLIEPTRLLATTVVRLIADFRAEALSPVADPARYDLAAELAEIDFSTPEAIATWHESLSAEGRVALADPMVHHVAAVPLAASVGPRNLAAALSVLSRIDIVGTEETEEFFVSTLKATTEVDQRFEAAETPHVDREEEALVEAIEKSPGAAMLTVYDRMFYDICNLGLTSDKPNMDDAYGILQRA